MRSDYNLIMSRWVLILIACVIAAAPAGAQNQSKQPAKPAAQQPVEQEPPEEDADLKPKDYAFNPLQANKELQVGMEYYKKGSYKAAAGRFREATKWNPNFAEAWLRLGEAEQKRKNRPDAKDAYQKYLQLEPNGKDAGEVRKKLAGLH